MKKLLKRMKGPTPPFFKKIRNIGVMIASVSGAVLAAPVALPAAIVTAAGYLAVAGAVAGAVSQVVTNPEAEDDWKDEVTGTEENRNKW
jgi:ABC-type xylose transport system permease subunit